MSFNKKGWGWNEMLIWLIAILFFSFVLFKIVSSQANIMGLP